MKTFLKTSAIAITLIAGMAMPAQAADYKMKVQWNGSQTVEQNYKEAAEKIEQFCKIRVRRASGVRGININDHTDHCESQLMKSYVKSVGKTALTQYHAERTNPSKLDAPVIGAT